MCCITDLVVVIAAKSCSTARLVISSIITFFYIAILMIWSDPNQRMDYLRGGCSSGGRKKENTESEKLINQLLNDNVSLQSKLEEEKNKWTEIFGEEFERKAKHNFNNTSDSSTPTEISEEFQNIYDGEWRDAMRCYKADEEQGIIILSGVLQYCQVFCQDIAQKQLMMFINPCYQRGKCDVTQQPSMTDQLNKSSLSEEEIHSLYKMRRKISQHKLILDSVVKSFYEECLKDEKIKDVINKQDSADCYYTNDEDEESEDGKKIHVIEAYIKKCTQLCWQAAISDPPVYLNFDVINHPFDEIKSKFTKYAGKTSSHENDKLNYVKHVVWPAVVTKCSENEKEKLIGDGKGVVIIPDSTSI